MRKLRLGQVNSHLSVEQVLLRAHAFFVCFLKEWVGQTICSDFQDAFVVDLCDVSEGWVLFASALVAQVRKLGWPSVTDTKFTVPFTTAKSVPPTASFFSALTALPLASESLEVPTCSLSCFWLLPTIVYLKLICSCAFLHRLAYHWAGAWDSGFSVFTGHFHFLGKHSTGWKNTILVMELPSISCLYSTLRNLQKMEVIWLHRNQAKSQYTLPPPESLLVVWVFIEHFTVFPSAGNLS